jgi:hypothetical protein
MSIWVYTLWFAGTIALWALVLGGAAIFINPRPARSRRRNHLAADQALDDPLRRLASDLPAGPGLP